eukprot:scaffold213561_cov22-Prasinocladus_malaysianus.AAC.1
MKYSVRQHPTATSSNRLIDSRFSSCRGCNPKSFCQSGACKDDGAHAYIYVHLYIPKRRKGLLVIKHGNCLNRRVFYVADFNNEFSYP